MNKFMGGLTLGIIITVCFFIYFKPFQKNVAPGEASAEPLANDSLSLSLVPTRKDTNTLTAAIDQKMNTVRKDSLVSFSKTLIGIPYLYGSANPAKGFDCSGFITYVFSHFNISVPRSSFEFANIGNKKTLANCQPGDIILFTGTDPQEKAIGHIGIICDIVDGHPSFIHSTSGKANGVTITSMNNKFYQERFIGITDLFSK